MNFSTILQMFNQLKQLLKSHRWFWLILVIGFLIRVALNSAVDSFDFYAFVMWAKYLTTHRIADAFEFLPEGYTPYPPLYYYLLKGLGLLINFIGVWGDKWLTYLIVRMPVIAADVAVTWMIYRFTFKFLSIKEAIVGAAFYFLHPATIYNTSIWGQIDSVVTFMGIVSIFAFIYKKYFWAVGIYIMGVITKLQILALLPLVAFLSLVEVNMTRLIRIFSLWLPIASLPFLPIVAVKGFKWTWEYFFTIPNWYAYTSVYTFNLWAPFGFLLSDNTKFINLIALKWLGIFLFWSVAGLIIYPLRRKVNRRPLTLLFAAFLLWYDFSFFATRIHSRYLIYSFGFFAPFISRFPKLGVGLSLLMFANFLLPNKAPVLIPVVTFLNQPYTVWLFVIFGLSLFLYAYRSYQQLLSNSKSNP